jgi:hypothetical protein
VERSKLPHASRRFNPYGDAAPRHRGTSARRAVQPQGRATTSRALGGQHESIKISASDNVRFGKSSRSPAAPRLAGGWASRGTPVVWVVHASGSQGQRARTRVIMEALASERYKRGYAGRRFNPYGEAAPRRRVCYFETLLAIRSAKVVSTSASARGAVSARPVARLRPRRSR